MEELAVCERPGCSNEFIRFPYNKKYCHDTCKRATWNTTRRQKPTNNEVTIDPESGEFLRKELVRLARENERLKHTKGLQSAIVHDALVQGLSKWELEPIQPPSKDVRTHGEEVAVAVLSDLQLSKVTPTYNSMVCEERIELYASKIEHMTEIQRADHPVRECHVWMLGDEIEGEGIFPGQAYHIDAGFYRQVTINGPRIVGNFLQRMLQVFDKVKVLGVIGNHGRISSLSRFEFDPESNGDRMLYRILALMFANEPRIEFVIPDGPGERNWYAIDTIGNYRCLLCHGDQFKTFGSMYSIGRKVLGWKAGAIEEPFDDVCMGHWHQSTKMTFGFTVLRVASTTESTNTYAQEQLASMGGPSQLMMFVHPDKGIVTCEYDIHLDSD